MTARHATPRRGSGADETPGGRGRSERPRGLYRRHRSQRQHPARRACWARSTAASRPVRSGTSSSGAGRSSGRARVAAARRVPRAGAPCSRRPTARFGRGPGAAGTPAARGDDPCPVASPPGRATELGPPPSRPERSPSCGRSWRPLYRAIATVTGARVIVDSSKLPSYLAVLRGVDGLDVRTVHLVRDPRAAAFSWQRAKALTDGARRATMERISPPKSARSGSGWNALTDLGDASDDRGPARPRAATRT